ncbi:hypothetical protein [Pseudomonas peli]|uniref:hypothetical protein n=1 Tax=Pseudomonas peli TaxID=592361 RepID=UPI0024AD3956|nr:hypothetical protein [Pseudomonas peli]
MVRAPAGSAEGDRRFAAGCNECDTRPVCHTCTALWLTFGMNALVDVLAAICQAEYSGRAGIALGLNEPVGFGDDQPALARWR